MAREFAALPKEDPQLDNSREGRFISDAEDIKQEVYDDIKPKLWKTLYEYGVVNSPDITEIVYGYLREAINEAVDEQVHTYRVRLEERDGIIV